MSGTTRVSRYQKGKTRKVKANLDLLEQELVSGSGICWALCKSAPHPRQPRQHPITSLTVINCGCVTRCLFDTELWKYLTIMEVVVECFLIIWALSVWKFLVNEVYTHTHTTILLLFWNLSGTTRVSRYQRGKTSKVKTNLDLLEQEIVSGSGICWAICKSAPHPRQPRQHSTTQFFYRLDALPATQPTASKHWRQMLSIFKQSIVNEV